MATITETSKEIALKYADKGTFRFDRIMLSATNAQLYSLANALNSFQTDEATSVIKVTSSLIV